MDYFSSDLHLQHKNILQYDKRAFESIEEHDEHLIKNICKTLKAGDNLYYLGDFIFGDKKKTESFLGTIASTGANLFFIKGNHDNDAVVQAYKKYGIYLGNMEEIRSIDGQHIILNHYAMRIWHNSHRSFWHLYGHSHDNLESQSWGKSMDVGIVSAKRILGEYRPFSFLEIKEILDKREIEVIDHHKIEIV